MVLPSTGIRPFLTVTVIADLIETEFVLFIGNHLLVGVPDSDDAFDAQVLRKTQKAGNILCRCCTFVEIIPIHVRPAASKTECMGRILHGDRSDGAILNPQFGSGWVSAYDHGNRGILDKGAPMGFATESFFRRVLSVTTTNAQGLLAAPVGERRAASTMASIFFASTGRSAYIFTLLLFSASSLNILSPFFCRLNVATKHAYEQVIVYPFPREFAMNRHRVIRPYSGCVL
jgi:hypothetical protein